MTPVTGAAGWPDVVRQRVKDAVCGIVTCDYLCSGGGSKPLCRTISDAALRALGPYPAHAAPDAVRAAALEEAAGLVEANQISTWSGGAELTPRLEDNREGLAYAAAIRRLSALPPEPEGVGHTTDDNRLSNMQPKPPAGQREGVVDACGWMFPEDQVRVLMNASDLPSQDCCAIIRHLVEAGHEIAMTPATIPPSHGGDAAAEVVRSHARRMWNIINGGWDEQEDKDWGARGAEGRLDGIERELIALENALSRPCAGDGA